MIMSMPINQEMSSLIGTDQFVNLESMMDSLIEFGNSDEFPKIHGDCCGVIGGADEVSEELLQPIDELFSEIDLIRLKNLINVNEFLKIHHQIPAVKEFSIGYPLNQEITDDGILFLTNRVRGNLRSLNLTDCVNLTDEGLNRVIEHNPGLTKLNITGCRRLTVKGIIRNLKFAKTIAGGKTGGIKCLKINRIFGITVKDFEELKLLLGVGVDDEEEEEGEIDVEVCPKCKRIQLGFFCSGIGCEGCRSCLACRLICANCERCLSNCDFDETFCLEFVCLDCLNQSPGGNASGFFIH